MFRNADKIAAIEDLRRAARRRLPRFAFDFIDGGAEDEIGLSRNRLDFDEIQMTPRYLRDVTEINTEVALFGKTYGVPFGIAPVGFMNMAWPGTDLALARLAAEKNIPIGVSTAASTPLEQMAETAEGKAWFQLYASDDQDWVEHLIGRAEAAGYDVLMLTVDVSKPGKRDRDIRNGLQMPFRATPRVCLDLALHPLWSLTTLAAGVPRFANIQEGALGRISLAEMQRSLLSGRLVWEDVARLRDRWPHHLLIKGILHPDDAVQAVELGCDGIVVSNHGGRQADYAPSSIAALPGIAATVGDRATVLLDSGVRRGADLVRAKALGADAVLAGRPFAFGAAAGCAERPFEILDLELQSALGQLGTPVFGDVSTDVLMAPRV